MRKLLSRKLHPLLILVVFLASLQSVTVASKSLYETLGVSKSCSATDLKKGYRKQCLVHHPDKGGDEDKFKEVTRAYDILSDDSKRKTYDNYGDSAVNENGEMPQTPQNPFGEGPGGGASSFFSGSSGPGGGGPGGGTSFSSFNFGGMDGDPLFGSSSSSRNSETSGMNMDFEELLRQMTGGPPGGGGTSTRSSGSPFGMGGQQQQYEKAPPKAYTRDCPCTLEELATGATKKMKVKFSQNKAKVYTVKLQMGWKAGTKIKFNASKDGKFGPMIFVIQEKKHALLERRGNDLLYRHDLGSAGDVKANKSNITTDDDYFAIVKLELVLPDGEVWTRSLAKSSSFLRQGQTLTVTDKGMPIKGGPSRGNLIIEFFDSSASKTSSSRGSSQESGSSDASRAKQQPS